MQRREGKGWFWRSIFAFFSSHNAIFWLRRAGNSFRGEESTFALFLVQKLSV
jgi:hypothetical protein